MLNLHLGAFDRILPGWVNTDITPHLYVARVPGLARLLYSANRMTEARYLQHQRGVFRQLRKLDVTRRFPFSTATVNAIHISHMLSNLTRAGAHSCLTECYRVLKPGGILRISTVDLDAAVQAYDPAHPGVFLDLLFDLDTSPRAKNRHWWHYNQTSLTALLQTVGFADVTRWDYGQGRCPDVDRIDTRPGSLFLEASK